MFPVHAKITLTLTGLVLLMNLKQIKSFATVNTNTGTFYRIGQSSSLSTFRQQQEEKDCGARTTATMAKSMRHIQSVKEIADSHSIFLLDMWGVMHNGSKPYNGVVETIQNLKRYNNKMIILSNSSKRRDTAVKMLNKLGFDPDDFHQIITSGEVSHRLLSGDTTLPCKPWKPISDILSSAEEKRRKVFVFGSGDEDIEYCQSCGWTLAPITEANLILARGTFTLNDGTPDDVISKNQNEEIYFESMEQTLSIAAERRIPMLVSNPDKVRPDEGLPPMPGAIGDAYASILKGMMDEGEQIEGKLIKRIGKPYREVYDIALEGDNGDVGLACMVGDALETDVTGGCKIGCSTLWVINDGIHAPAINDHDDYEEGILSELMKHNEKSMSVDLSPTFIVPHFRW